MSEFIIKLFIFLTGTGIGFLVACVGSARIVAEKHDLKIALEKMTRERDALKNDKTQVIEIKDERLPSGDYFKPF